MKSASWALGLAAVGAQISYPLTTAGARDGVSIAVVVLLAGACAVHAAATRGPRWAAGLLATTAGGGLLVEVIGTATGLPFGTYTYATGRLGPVLAGVPLLIGLAWTAGAYPAWCAAERVASGHRLPRILLAAVGLAGWDLYLDPQMVTDGRWTWAPGFAGLPGLPEIPLSNYLGWALTAVVMACVLHLLPGQPCRHTDALPVTLYLWAWLGSGLAHAVFLDLRVSAVYGLVAMGVLGIPVLCSLRRAAPATSASGGIGLARWARAAFRGRTVTRPPVSSGGLAVAHCGTVAHRLSTGPDDHGDLR